MGPNYVEKGDKRDRKIPRVNVDIYFAFSWKGHTRLVFLLVYLSNFTFQNQWW